MGDKTISAYAGAKRFFGRPLSAFSSSGLLLTAAAVLHVALALGIHWTGRAQLAPNLIDGDGIMASFAFDSYEYQRGAERLSEVLRRDGVVAWAAEREPVHVRLISIQFALLGSLAGYGTLSAEPFNLLCYLAIVGFALLLGREVGGERAGLLAAGVVALWPTFLLHTLQLLKDPLFIAGALALVLCVTTLLTRTYGRANAVAACAFMSAASLLLLLVRFQFAVVILALVFLGFALLVVRQLVGRRTLFWNMASPLLILTAGALLLLPSIGTPPVQKFKHYPSDGGGLPKSAVSEGKRVPTVVTYLPRASTSEEAAPSYAGELLAAADRVAHRIGSVRYRFSAVYSKAGSGIDRNVRFNNLASLILYLPRAFAIGCCAPFPDTWVDTGRQVGNAGKLLSGAETLVMYVFGLLALVAVLRPPRRLAALLLLSITAFGVTTLGIVVPNVGALYRFRYTFWVLLIILGAKGLESVLASAGQRRREGGAVQTD